MRIVIFTVGHVYANYLVKKLINNFGNNVILIVESGVLLHNKTLLSSVEKYLEISGFYYVAVQAIKLQIFQIFSKTYTILFRNRMENKLFSYKTLARRKNIKTMRIKNINSGDSILLLRKAKPDLIVSCYFNQILSSKIIKTAKSGVINIHPAYLPDYKGVSPVFWALANGESDFGTTVHYIDAGIDTGKIIKRKKLKIQKHDSEDSLYWRCTKVGSKLLLSTIRGVGNKKKHKLIPNKGGRYFSLPQKEMVANFKRQGRKFFKINEYLFSQ